MNQTPHELSRRGFLGSLGAAMALGTLGLKAGTAAAKPNIVVILADDMGYSDLGCFGSEIATPNLDALAAGGVTFTDFYNTARCCPTRASLMTGLWSHQAGVGNMTVDTGAPGYRGHLTDSCVTIAEVLGDGGYATAMAGKWHLGGEDISVPPWKRGFQKCLWAPHGGFYWTQKDSSPWYLGPDRLPPDHPQLQKLPYATDLITEKGLEFASDAAAQGKPFFLYMAQVAPHFPLSAPAEEVEKLVPVYREGWDALRQKRFERQTRRGIVDPRWPLSPFPKSRPRTDDVPAWDSLGAEQKEKSARIMATYAACVTHMDREIGRFIAGLKDRGLYENTLIFFMSDNGAEKAGDVFGKIGKGQDPARSPGAHQGQAWATLSNTPFRQYKSQMQEGGISTPLLVSGPGVVKPGRICRDLGHVVDIMPTVLSAAGLSYPARFQGREVLPMEGMDLTPAFRGGSVSRAQLTWEHVGNKAIRQGPWKLVQLNGEPWELYRMDEDRTELRNLAPSEPARVEAMAKDWDTWANRAKVFPLPTKGTKKGKTAEE